MSEPVQEDPVYACCSAGIGRWFWVAWASESDARDLAPALASGYEKSADAAERKAIESVGPLTQRLPAKWASGYRRRGGTAARSDDPQVKPRSRLSRPSGSTRSVDLPTRLAFLYAASESDRPGEVAVVKHRIVRQTPRKIHIDREVFREEEWASWEEGDGPKPKTLPVDRDTLRREGRITHRRSNFYASEEDGIRDVHATLTARHAWCAALGVRFPCTVESVKAAYRRLARSAHPDVGGEPAEFRAVEQAYREALAYLAPLEGEPARFD